MADQKAERKLEDANFPQKNLWIESRYLCADNHLLQAVKKGSRNQGTYVSKKLPSQYGKCPQLNVGLMFLVYIHLFHLKWSYIILPTAKISKFKLLK
jgi:hypothetical protein